MEITVINRVFTYIVCLITKKSTCIGSLLASNIEIWQTQLEKFHFIDFFFSYLFMIWITLQNKFSNHCLHFAKRQTLLFSMFVPSLSAHAQFDSNCLQLWSIPFCLEIASNEITVYPRCGLSVEIRCGVLCSLIVFVVHSSYGSSALAAKAAIFIFGLLWRILKRIQIVMLGHF